MVNVLDRLLAGSTFVHFLLSVDVLLYAFVVVIVDAVQWGGCELTTRFYDAQMWRKK